MTPTNTSQSSFIDLQKTNYSSNAINENVFIPFYEELTQSSKKNHYLFLASPLIVLADGIITLAQTISFAVETVLKGIAHVIVGILTLSPKRLSQGAFQILSGAAVGVASPFHALYRVAKISYRFNASFQKTLIDQLSKKSTPIEININFDGWMNVLFLDTDSEWNFSSRRSFSSKTDTGRINQTERNFTKAGGVLWKRDSDPEETKTLI